MSPEPTPTLRAVRLGQELRKVRDEVGFSVRKLGDALGVQPGTLSKKERGQVPATRSDVDDYLRACHIHDPKRRDDLYKICRDVLQKGWWDGYAEDIAGTLMDRIWLESKAISIDTFENIVVPGLLQTPGYAEALMRLDRPDAADEDIQRWLEVRTTRQHILTRHDPIQYRAIIDQAALSRPAGDATAMKRQLDYLVKAADFENVELRVLPFRAGMHASFMGAFEVLSLEGPYPPAGLVQVPGGDVCVEGTAIDLLRRKYDQLVETCLTTEESKDFILAERSNL